MPSLKFFLNNKRFLCVVLVLAAGSLSLLMIVSHAAWQNTTPLAYKYHPDMGVTLEIEKVVFDTVRSGVSLERFAGAQELPATFVQHSTSLDGYKTNDKKTPSDDRAVWMSQVSILSGYNHDTKENRGNQASNDSVELGLSYGRTTIGGMGVSYLRSDLDSGINEQKNQLNVHTLSSAGIRSTSHTELVAAEPPPSPAPEPTTMILVGSGLVFLTTVVRKNFRG